MARDTCGGLLRAGAAPDLVLKVSFHSKEEYLRSFSKEAPSYNIMGLLEFGAAWVVRESIAYKDSSDWDASTYRAPELLLDQRGNLRWIRFTKVGPNESAPGWRERLEDKSPPDITVDMAYPRIKGRCRVS